jgi:MFS family permease
MTGKHVPKEAHVHDDAMTRPPDSPALAAATAEPVTSGSAAGSAEVLPPLDPPIGLPVDGDPPPAKVSRREIALMLLTSFGASMALVVPLTYSLTVRVDELAPGRADLLGYVKGTAQTIYIVASPLIGMWSDRFRSRIGRRRPFMIGGMVVGLAGTLVMAQAPSILVVGAGWILAMLGLSTIGAIVLAVQAERLPEEQRGKVSGLNGLAVQVAPVLGIGAVSTVSENMLLLFLIPAGIGLLICIPFIIGVHDPDSRALARSTERVSPATMLTSYVFNPRKYPDFAWNWLGRLVFYFGLYANTTFGTFFYAQRLGVDVTAVAAVVAVTGLLGIAAAFVGAIGGGFLSDRLRRRKLFTLIGALLFAVGAVIEATAYSLTTLILGSVVMSLAIAAFSAVDQAIVIAVLPDRNQAARYMAVVAFAQRIPSAAVPLLAPLVLTVGAAGGPANFTLLYLVGGVFALLGGLIIILKVKSVR